MKTGLAAILLLGGFTWIFAQEVPPDRGLLRRRYQEGEKLTYRMKAANEDWRYEIQATGVVKRDAGGMHVEEYAWSNLISNGAAVALPPASLEFRQELSLDPDKPPSIPDLGKVHPMLIGPITDLLTFYADLWLAARLGKLTQAGDQIYQAHGAPASWADGSRVVLGESSIDFDLTLTGVDHSNEVATLLVRHVPPKQSRARLPAAWMREPAADTPNNWVNVTKKKDGHYVAAVGKETFEVRMEVSLADGKILSETMDNLVTGRERDCRDAALAVGDCGEPRPRKIRRQIEIRLER